MHSKFAQTLNFFYEKIDRLKTILKNNSYPESFIDICIERYLDKVFIKTEIILEASKRKNNLSPSFYWKKLL